MEQGYPNSKKGFKCNLTKRIEDGWDLLDFYRKKRRVTSLEDLYEHFIVFTNQRQENLAKKFPGLPPVKRDDYLDFIIHRNIGICPQGIITATSKYWLEIVSYCDGEHGLNLPAKMEELPDLFFQSLGIVRNVKSQIRKEEERGGKKNSHNN